MIVLMAAGIAVVLAGLLAIAYGIPVKEFGFGNTLILTGTIGACTGLIMLSLVLVLRELTALVRRSAAAAMPRPRGEARLSPIAEEMAEDDVDADDEDEAPEQRPAREAPLFSRDQPASTKSLAKSSPTSSDRSGATPASPPWQDEALRDRERMRAQPAAPVSGPDEPTDESRPRRNLLFSSSSRKERERAAATQSAAPAQPDLLSPEPAVPDNVAPAAPRSFEDAWPQSERARAEPSPRRAARTPSTFSDAPPPAPVEPAAVTVLKSGVVDGMAYSLYSDGSIEAQMPEGMMRFASIDELREHLDHRV